MRTPELDYAFLCGYATIHGNSLTVVDASFTRMIVGPTPSSTGFSIAGRVRLDEQAGPTELSIRIDGPEGALSLTLSTEISPDGADKYDGKAGVLFATQIHMPIPVHGLYTAAISLEGVDVRVLKFEALPDPGGQGEA